MVDEGLVESIKASDSKAGNQGAAAGMGALVP